jgi:hypothetical protein
MELWYSPHPCKRLCHDTVSSLPACAAATARVCRAHGAQTGADRFRIWSAFMCGHPKSKTDCSLVIGKAVSRLPVRAMFEIFPAPRGEVLLLDGFAVYLSWPGTAVPHGGRP